MTVFPARADRYVRESIALRTPTERRRVGRVVACRAGQHHRFSTRRRNRRRRSRKRGMWRCAWATSMGSTAFTMSAATRLTCGSTATAVGNPWRPLLIRASVRSGITTRSISPLPPTTTVMADPSFGGRHEGPPVETVTRRTAGAGKDPRIAAGRCRAPCRVAGQAPARSRWASNSGKTSSTERWPMNVSW